jgi:hypothetical protein
MAVYAGLVKAVPGSKHSELRSETVSYRAQGGGTVSLMQLLEAQTAETGWLLGQQVIREHYKENCSGEYSERNVWGDAARLAIGILAAVVYGR